VSGNSKTQNNNITNWLSNNGVEWVSVGGSENITEKLNTKYNQTRNDNSDDSYNNTAG